MYIRRYYKKGKEIRGKTISDEFFKKLVDSKGIETALFMDNANYDIIFESEEERTQYLNDSYNRVIENIGWYLQNLEEVPTFSASQFIYYENMSCFTPEGGKINSKPKGL